MPPKAPPVETQLANAVLIPRDKIWASRQPREFFEETAMAELAQSIREHGLLQPLAVRYEPNRYDGRQWRLIAGERRYRASEGILDLLPCMVQRVDADSAAVLTLVENLQREDLTALEEARGLSDLMTARGLSALRAAKALGKSAGWVNNRLALLKTKPDVQAVAARAPLAMSSLLLIDTVKDSELRSDLLEQVEANAPHSQIKARVEAHNAEKAHRSGIAPDKETASRTAENARTGGGNVSRGKPVKGLSARETNQNAAQAVLEAEWKAETVAHWLEKLNDKERAKLTPRLKALAKRFEAMAD